MKKIFSILLSVCLVLAMLPTIALADDSGTLTKTINWSFANNTLTISGTGKMPTYSNGTQSPWSSHATEIYSVVIEPGITRVGDFTFYGLNVYPNLSSVTLPEGLLEIGRCCFCWREQLMSCNLPDSLVRIGPKAFYCTYIPEFHIGANLKSVGNTYYINDTLDMIDLYDYESAFNSTNGATCFTVDPQNETFTAIDGVLYTKDMKTLLSFPTGNTSKTVLEIPYGVETIASFAFFTAPYIQKVYLPATLKRVSSLAFNTTVSLTEFYFYGNAPSQAGTNAYLTLGRSYFTFYVLEGTTGWDSGWDNYISGSGLAIETFENDGRYPESSPIVLGDADGDKEVSLVDALLMLRSLAGWTVTLDEVAADVNSDGVVSQIDAMLILRHLAGWSVEQFA